MDMILTDAINRVSTTDAINRVSTTDAINRVSTTDAINRVSTTPNLLPHQKFGKTHFFYALHPTQEITQIAKFLKLIYHRQLELPH